MQAIAQMKPTISRAIAVVTTTFGLPDAARRRYRAHRRTCAFHAMPRITGDSGSTVMQLAADPGSHPVCPGSFDQHAPHQRIAGLGDAAATDCAPGGMLAGHQTEVGHQLPGIGEASEVAHSATTVTATTRATPRIACSAATTGAIDQLGSISSICRVSRSRLASASSTAWM